MTFCNTIVVFCRLYVVLLGYAVLCCVVLCCVVLCCVVLCCVHCIALNFTTLLDQAFAYNVRYCVALSYVYTLRLIGPISYPGECDFATLFQEGSTQWC